jgi:NADPH-dependent 2,4-dienoyl-CoA reductase/sulfur reductase-like enzyme
MEYHIVIVGGGPAGIITALTAKSVYPEKSVCVIKDIGDGIIPCAIPYMIHTMNDPQQNVVDDMPLEKAGVEIILGKVISFNAQERKVVMETGDIHSYERLVLATGTKMVLPPIPGIENPGVYTIQKSMSAMKALRAKIEDVRKVAIIGGGFIGAEFADELSKMPNKKIHLIEIMPKLLSSAFDDEFCDQIADELIKEGVHVHTNCGVSAVEGSDHVKSVQLKGGEKIDTDIVLVSVGAKPSIQLARNAGLRIDEGGSIWVDEYMRTTAEGVFAVGDCAVKRDFFTRKAVPIWLASTATAEARNAGTNIYGIRVMHQIHGTIAAFSTKIGGVYFASTGMTSKSCEKETFRNITAKAEAPDRHPGTLPGAHALKVKLLFADRSGLIMGGQMSGGPSVGELINTVALAIQKGVTVREMDMMQIATHPMLTSSPTAHPLINAAHIALGKLRQLNKN